MFTTIGRSACPLHSRKIWPPVVAEFARRRPQHGLVANDGADMDRSPFKTKTWQFPKYAGKYAGFLLGFPNGGWSAMCRDPVGWQTSVTVACVARIAARKGWQALLTAERILLWILVKADSTRRSSQAVPHPSTDRALCRLTSEVRRDPVHSTRYGRRRCQVVPRELAAHSWAETILCEANCFFWTRGVCTLQASDRPRHVLLGRCWPRLTFILG